MNGNHDSWRYKTDDHPISVAYGYDGASAGVFFCVFDSRLKYDPNAAGSVNEVTESIGVMDGGGSYFDLHTGHSGFGIKVSDETMIVYLKRYNVNPEHILKLFPSSRWTGGGSKTVTCNRCGAVKNLNSCGGCGVVRYCSRDCQKQDWNLHKKICLKNKK